jgi:hypothetical protein
LTIAADRFKNNIIENEREDEKRYHAAQNPVVPVSSLISSTILTRTCPSIRIFHVKGGARYRDENIIDISLFFGETAAG